MVDRFDANAARTAYRLSLEPDHCRANHDCNESLRWTSHEDGKDVVYLVDPDTGVLTRFFLSLVSLLPIEGQL